MPLALLGNLSIQETDIYAKEVWTARVDPMVSLLVVVRTFTDQGICQASPWKRPEDPPRSKDPHLRSVGGELHPESASRQ